MINNIFIVGCLILAVSAVIYAAVQKVPSLPAPSGNVPLIYRCNGKNCIDGFHCIEYYSTNGTEKGRHCTPEHDFITRYKNDCYLLKFDQFDEVAEFASEIFKLPIRWCNGPDKVGAYYHNKPTDRCTAIFIERKEFENSKGYYYDNLEDCQGRGEKAISALPILWDCNGKDCPVGRCVFYDRETSTKSENVDCENNKYTFLKQSAGKGGCQVHKYKNYKSVFVKDLDTSSCEVKGRYYGYDFNKKCAVRWFNSEEHDNSDYGVYDDDFFENKEDCLEKLNSRCDPKEESKYCFAGCFESTCKEIRENKRGKRLCSYRSYMCSGRECVCVDGHVRDDDGKCIPENQCPRGSKKETPVTD